MENKDTDKMSNFSDIDNYITPEIILCLIIGIICFIRALIFK